MSKININDPAAWLELNWDDPAEPTLLKKTDQQVAVSRHNRLRSQTPEFKDTVEKIRQSNIKTRKENPLTSAKKKRIGDAMRGKTLEEMLGENRAAKGRKSRSEASKGKQRPKEVVDKIVAKKKATGVYESENHGMRGKTHKESTKAIQGQKAKIRQELKRKLGLGKSDSVPKDLLEKEYKRKGIK
jgi:hypothetical protein